MALNHDWFCPIGDISHSNHCRGWEGEEKGYCNLVGRGQECWEKAHNELHKLQKITQPQTVSNDEVENLENPQVNIKERERQREIGRIKIKWKDCVINTTNNILSWGHLNARLQGENKLKLAKIILSCIGYHNLTKLFKDRGSILFTSTPVTDCWPLLWIFPPSECFELQLHLYLLLAYIHRICICCYT